jgi:single-stranded-DNA-specific exonuclease
MSWTLATADAQAAQDISRRLGLPRALGPLLAQRGCATAEEAQKYLGARGDVGFMAGFHPSPSMRTAMGRLREAKQRNERVVIYGDYDADGVTGTSILHRFFSVVLGLDAHPFLPSRFKEGYGLNARVIPELAAQGTQLIVTTDNGITAVEAAEACKAHGIDLVITDHHSAKDVIPDALAVVHPKVDFPEYSALSGAGVAYMLCLAMADNDVKKVGQLLDIACIGTLGDMVPLTPYNRALVHLGLKRWNMQNRRPGAQALLEAYNAANPRYPVETVTATDLGFVIAPLINAAGRMEHPKIAYDLLTAQDPETARAIADQLVALNSARKEETKALFEEVSARIDREMPAERYPFIVLDGEGWHHGLVGLVAGRVLEKYRRPVILLGDEEHEPTLYRGSGRAPKGVSLLELLTQTDRYLHRWGGHAAAAGCGVKKEHIVALREALNEALNATGWRYGETLPEAHAVVTLDELGDGLFDALDLLEPHGQENPRPLLALEDVKIDRGRSRKGHLFARVGEGRLSFEVVGWFKGDLFPLPPRADLLFHLERATDFYSGEPVMRLNLQHLLPANSRLKGGTGRARDSLLA